MIYFDNAATGGIKPQRVINSVGTTVRYLSVNAGHSGHKRAVIAEEYIYKTRKLLQRFFNAESCERVIFTKNCTEALNTAIFGLVSGGNVVTSAYEHNSVLRPLYCLKRQNKINLTVIKPKFGAVLKEDIENAIDENTTAVILNGASNVTGELCDYEAIGGLLKEKDITFILDGAQVCGHAIVDMKNYNIDVLCFSGHKGMHGIQGSGGLIFNKKTQIPPLMFGGTGTESFSEIPSGYPELLECGTQNLPSIVSLMEGVLYNTENFKRKQKRIIALTAYAINGLSQFKNVKIYSGQNPVGIVAFSLGNYSSQEVAGILSEQFDIATRGGYHCAPLCHKFLGTDQNGLVRLSFSEFNTEDEIELFLSALQKVPSFISD